MTDPIFLICRQDKTFVHKYIKKRSNHPSIAINIEIKGPLVLKSGFVQMAKVFLSFNLVRGLGQKI